MISRIVSLLLAAGVLASAAPALADTVKKRDTIASLESKTVEVRPGRRIFDSSNKARDNYRAFLDLVSDDPALSADAMRRLATLNWKRAKPSSLPKILVRSNSKPTIMQSACFMLCWRPTPTTNEMTQFFINSHAPMKLREKQTIRCAF